MGHGAVGGFTGQLHHLRAGEGGFADDRLGPALLAQLAQQAGRLFLVGVGEDGVGAGLLGLQHRRREVDLALVGGNLGHHLGVAVGQQLLDGGLPALAEVVVHVDHRQLLRLAVDVARQLGEGHALPEGRAEHIGVALGGDGGCLAAGEIGHLGAAALGHADHDGAREHRAEDGEGVLVDGLLRQALGHARVALRVFGGVDNLAAQDTASGIDLLDGHLHPVLEHGARGGARAGQLDDVGDADVLRLGQAGHRGQRGRQRKAAEGSGTGGLGHGCLLWWAQVNVGIPPATRRCSSPVLCDYQTHASDEQT